jgi:flagellar motility protein MotE (MotC chaperone)
MPVLLRVARAMNPRKMAPVLARMDPMRAKSLTAGMATEEAEPTLDVAAEDLSSLPQIVGQ